jgi:5'-methylthioadenosine phosphorylase
LTPRIGIIGGTGLGQALGTLGSGQGRSVSTPYGDPSGEITLTEISGVPVALLARHGAGHRFSPSEVNYRANL